MKMLDNSLLTEDGFINEACLKELKSVIDNMPKTYERLADDPEWSAKYWTNRSEIVGGLAKWACRQSPIGVPNFLTEALRYLDTILKPMWNGEEIIELSLCEINKILHDTMYDLEILKEWNSGVDFIDLDALLHNVCLDIRLERRAFDAFNKKFEEKYGHLD